MSGENKSVPTTTKDLVEKIDRTLDNYEKELGIRLELDNEATKLLNITKEELASFSAEECGISAYILSKFAFFLQKSYNKERARITWAEETIKTVICHQTPQYKSYSYEERRLQATRNDEHARKLDDIRMYAKQRSDRIAYLSTRTDFMAKTLLDLQQTKRRNFNG